MNEMITIIKSMYKKLTDKEKESVAFAISTHFEKPTENVISELTSFTQDELTVIRDLLNGLILTKENKLNIIQDYNRISDTDLTRKIHFGRLTED